MELFQQTYDELKNENELAILEKYWNTTRRYSEIIASKKIIFKF